jgi:hypothetical protein
MAKRNKHIEGIQGHKSHLEGSSEAANKGCVTKCVGSAVMNHHGSYRKNGYEEHKNNPVKSTRYAPIANRIKRYHPVAEQLPGEKKGITRIPELPVGDKGLWIFEGEENFKKAYSPFPHMYHHMVPWEVLKKTFSFNELILFQRSGYNLNDGINLIILPCSERIGSLIGMYSHPNDHPGYTEQLIAQLTSLRTNLSGDQEEHLQEKEVGYIKDCIEAWARAEWFQLADSGKAALGMHVNTYSPSCMATAFANVGP